MCHFNHLNYHIKHISGISTIDFSTIHIKPFMFYKLRLCTPQTLATQFLPTVFCGSIPGETGPRPTHPRQSSDTTKVQIAESGSLTHRGTDSSKAAVLSKPTSSPELNLWSSLQLDRSRGLPSPTVFPASISLGWAPYPYASGECLRLVS